MKIFGIVLGLVMGFSTIAYGDPGDGHNLSSGIYDCSNPKNQDRWSLEKDALIPDAYILKYYNSVSKCSQSFENKLVVAEDGFGVYLYVKVGGDESNEVIDVIPANEQYMAFPPSASVPDGAEPFKFKIRGGIV